MADTFESFQGSDRLRTEEKNTIPPDVLKEKGAKQDGCFTAIKYRCGSSWIVDESEGFESITIQHRSGTEVQFMPDGAIVFRVNKGKYEEVSGESIIIVEGKHDITVKGDASLRVEGDCRQTVMGNMDTTVDGDFSMTARNINMTSRGAIDTVAKNMAIITSTNFALAAGDTLSLDGKNAATFSSYSGSVRMRGYDKVGVKSTGGKVAIEGGSGVSIRAKGGGMIAMDGNQEIRMNEGVSVEDAEEYTQRPNPAKTVTPDDPYGTKGGPGQ